MRRSIRALTISAFSTLGGAILVAPFCTPAAQASPEPAEHDQATSASQARRVLDFWTPRRMRSATPLDDLLKDKINIGGRLRGAPRGLPEHGLPKVIKPRAAERAASPTNGGGPWTGGGAVVRTSGRVFFTFQGRTASCSGNAVTSANKSTVITAGHCVKLEGSFHTNWVFVPGYANGDRPFGTWTANKTLATTQWTANEDINHDVGAAVVNPLGGRSLTDVVGSQGIAFNQPRGRQMYAFGFPAAAPYDGERLIYCSGRVINDPLGLSQDQGLLCDMTGGSSGGPWFLDFSESAGTGVLNSVNSFKYNFLPTHMFGPYFGDSAEDLYQEAQG